MEFLPIVILFGALYFFMFVPQQRRAKAHQQLISSLAEGDLVVTNAGIHGAIAEVEDDVVWVEVAPEVELKISKSAIAERLAEDDTDDEDDNEFVEADTEEGDA